MELPLCSETVSAQCHTASNVPELPPYGGRIQRRLVLRRQRPPNLTERAQTSRPSTMGAGGSDEMPYFRGVKRLHLDNEHRGCLTLLEETNPADFSASGADNRSSSSEPLQIRPAKSAIAEAAMGKGQLPGVGISLGRQHSARVVLARAPTEESLRTPDSDISEKEAEIRAQVLDGARQLLQDEAEIDCLVQLRMRLHEKNTALLERAIHCRGVEECMELLKDALRVEANGGQLTAEGRRRTPGGVFLRLLQDRIPREDKRFIWDEQNREQRKLKRQRIQNRKMAGTLAPLDRWCKCTSAPFPANQQETTDIVREELEPGELDADQVDPHDSMWT